MGAAQQARRLRAAVRAPAEPAFARSSPDVVPDVSGHRQDVRLRCARRPRRSARRIIVRVPLAGRRVGGWVVRLGATSPGQSPSTSTTQADRQGDRSRRPTGRRARLVRWASDRWGAGRLRPFLVGRSPPGARARASAGRGSRRRRCRAGARRAALLAARCPAAPARRRCATTPADDPLPIVLAACRLGRCSSPVPASTTPSCSPPGSGAPVEPLRSCPGSGQPRPAASTSSSGRRRRRGRRVAELAAGVVLDEHDEALQEERTPPLARTGRAVERARRRCGRAPRSCHPAPTLTAAVTPLMAGRRAAAEPSTSRRPAPAGRWSSSSTAVGEGREHRSLVTERPRRGSCATAQDRRLRHQLARPGPACSRVGRAGRSSAARCASAAVAQADDGTFACARCGTLRPAACACSAGRRRSPTCGPGDARLREELEAAAQRPVVAVTGDSDRAPGRPVCTSAPRRCSTACSSADVGRLPRHRRRAAGAALPAAEQAMALLVAPPACSAPRAAGWHACSCRRRCRATRCCSRPSSRRSRPADRARRVGAPPSAAVPRRGAGRGVQVDMARLNTRRVACRTPRRWPRSAARRRPATWCALTPGPPSARR